jgi:hypothetical protein
MDQSCNRETNGLKGVESIAQAASRGLSQIGRGRLRPEGPGKLSLGFTLGFWLFESFSSSSSSSSSVGDRRGLPRSKRVCMEKAIGERVACTDRLGNGRGRGRRRGREGFEDE